MHSELSVRHSVTNFVKSCIIKFKLSFGVLVNNNRIATLSLKNKLYRSLEILFNFFKTYNKQTKFGYF